MTNGEKFKEIFSITQVDEGVLYAYAWLPNHDAAEISIDWWNAEYKEPVIRNDGVKNELNRVKDELEPTTKNDLGVDCISRKAVIDELKRYFHDEYYQRTSIQDCRDCFIEDVLNHLPSVTPQEPKTGHWIVHPKCIYAHLICNNCLTRAPYDCETNYCPNCGAKMVELQESEDKE